MSSVPPYEPIPFEEWKRANPELCPDEDCSECDGEGRVHDTCECSKCGDEHEAEQDCESCDGTGAEDAGGFRAYRDQVEADTNRWRAYHLQPRPGDVFVFGSNRQGRHGAGAAKRAVERFGAIPGQARGRQGDAYAIVTKELRCVAPPVTLGEIAEEVKTFLTYARDRPETRFLVTRLGGGLAGFDWSRQVRPLFDGRPGNVELLEDVEV